MTYSKYIGALLFICFALIGSSVSAQAYMKVSAGTNVQIACGTRVMVNATRLIPADTITTTMTDTISLGAVHTGPMTSDSVGMGSVIFAANCGTGFRYASNDNLSAWEVSLYPNPAASELFVDTKGFSGKTELTLLDISGKVVLSQSWEAEGDAVRNLNLQSLSSGLYLYRIINGAHNVSGKLVKE